MNRSRILLINQAYQANKFPTLISFNKFPWMIVQPGDSSFHTIMGQHYQQLLALATRRYLPAITPNVNNKTGSNIHPIHDLPPSKWAFTLPNMHYLIPHVDLKPKETPVILSNEQLPSEYTPETSYQSYLPTPPLDWDQETIEKHLYCHSYGCLENSLFGIESVSLYRSPDLKLYANCITFRSKYQNPAVAEENSTIYKVSGNMSHGFSIFHYYRPNRSPAELAKPFIKYYVHLPDIHIIPDQKDWVPQKQISYSERVLKKQKAKPMPYEPPTSYLHGLPEKEGIIPGGNCFGSRDLQWGFHW